MKEEPTEISRNINLKLLPLHSENSAKYSKNMDFYKKKSKARWAIGLILGKYLINRNMNYIIMITSQTYTLPFISIALQVYIS